LRDAEAATDAPFSMVLFDVDQIRSLNDRDAADLRVRKLAGLFVDLPGSGGLAGRHGADSFLCVLPGVDHAAATAFAEKIRAAVPQIGVTISAGVASAPADGVELRTVLRAARQALVQAKQAGRDRVVSAGPREGDLSTLLPSRALLGREGELSAAAPLFESIRRGRPAMMMVDGEPGSGKTRLLQELRDRARTAGLLPVSVTADDAKRTVPGAVLLTLIQEFYVRREASRKDLRDKLTKPQRYVLRDAVPCFRGWPPEVPAPEARDHEAVLSQALEAAVRSIAAEIPVLLLLDNAPAGDRTSFTILRELFRGGSLPLGLVAALKGPFAQIDERSADPAMLALWFESGRHGAKLLRTPPLPPNQIEMLLRTILLGAELPESFAARVAETSHGNPLYVEAALRGLGARGKIGRGQGGWTIAPLTEEDLPPTLDLAVRQLVDGLSPGAADLLNYAAVMSVVIDVDALQALGSWREAEVQDLLDLLEDRGLVRADTFSSGTLREAILRTLPPARLPEMRSKTSQVLKDLYGTSTAEAPAPPPAPAAPPPPPPSSPAPAPPAAPAAPAPVALGVAGLDAAIRFLQAIATELKIGRLYPKENRLRVEAREKLAHASRELTTISPRVTFAVGPQGVRVNDTALPPAGEAAARSFSQVLQEKALGALSLDRGVTPSDLGHLLDALVATTPHDPPPHVVLTPARAPLPEMPRTKTSELEGNAQAMVALPLAKLLSLETEKELPALFNGLIEGKLQKLMEPIVDRVGAALRDPEVAIRRQASALITRVMEQVSPGARELLIRRLEAPLAAAAVVEPDDLTLALVGNAVRAWISAAWALKQHRLLVSLASRLAFSPDFVKRSPVVKSVIVSTVSSMGTPAALEVIELISRGDPSIREGASRLGAMLGAAMVHPLVSLILTNGDITVRRLAASTLKEIGDGSRQLAAQVKLDTPPNVVRNVLSIYEIPAAGGGDVMAMMKVAAAHPDASVREATGALLVRAKNLFSPLQLSELLDRPDNVLQKSAIMAAKDLKAREAGAGVLKIAETTQDEEILRAACNYFRECPTEESLPLLSKLFSSRSRAFGLLKGMSDPTRVAATEALRRLNHPDVKKLLDLAQNDSSETVRRAAKPPPGGPTAP
jgi:diguanylate cyclase (GGDEF)-like protein